VAVIVSPVKNPSFDHKLVDRYLVLCQHWWVLPIICLNKIDLSKKRDPIIDQYRASWISVVECSTLEGIGILELKQDLLGKVTILLWKSWVGKSSLVNSLCSYADLWTQSVNSKSWEWKHTTTSSDLYKRAEASYIIDTPGIRALGLDHIAKLDLKNYFPEFWEYVGACKYDSCLHESEPDCAIKKAVAENKIDKWRYESYLRILQDLI
jgi:ribosome biogenesis GTPase